MANQRITSMLADYSDVVPRREFERMETAYKVRADQFLAGRQVKPTVCCCRPWRLTWRLSRRTIQHSWQSTSQHSPHALSHDPQRAGVYIDLVYTARCCPFRALQEVHGSVVAERDSLSSSLSHIKGTATPRPEWSRCERYVEGWGEASQARSSDQLVDLLLAKISSKPLEEVTTESGFQGQVRREG